MRVPQPFPYQGSKRKIAPDIVAWLPPDTSRVIEPFAGSGAVSLRAAALGKAGRFVFNDLNAALIELWRHIVNTPGEIADQYETLWHTQSGREKAFYFEIRDRFNQTHRPDYLLYLLARCVKASVRYNANGEFNQSPDNRRKGMQPHRMRENIRYTSALLKGRVSFTGGNYHAILDAARPTDVIYMDPPYQGVCNTADPRYVGGFQVDDFIEALHDLQTRHIPFILSFDGRTGAKEYGIPFPDTLKVRRIEINAGRSSQATLLGRNRTTFESLYISEQLASLHKTKPRTVHQLTLWS